jgi:hypothetical protein
MYVINYQWAKLSPIKYVNPHIGSIVFGGDKWEAIPRFYYEESRTKFTSLKEAINWMEGLHVNQSASI